MEDTKPYLAVSMDGRLAVICECSTKLCGHHVTRIAQFPFPPLEPVFIVTDFNIPDFIELRVGR